MIYPGITVTGADERTPLSELIRLTELSPRVEIGLLYTETPEGRNRYPSRVWLAEAAFALRGRCAIHVCGRTAREASFWGGPLWLQQAGRVQVNGRVRRCDLPLLTRYHQEIITQHDPPRTYSFLSGSRKNHALLVDASGGKGELPAKWVRPATFRPVGFAGGLGPDNLSTELPRIAAVALDPWWVDMEGKLRTTDDWFSVARAETAIEAFLGFLADQPTTEAEAASG